MSKNIKQGFQAAYDETRKRKRLSCAGYLGHLPGFVLEKLDAIAQYIKYKFIC